MYTISYTAARSNFSNTMEQVCLDHAPIVITRKNAEPVVMISLEDYNSMVETSYLLKSPKNVAKLLESIKDIETGKTLYKDVDED